MISQIAARPTWTPTLTAPPAPVTSGAAPAIADGFQKSPTPVVDHMQSLKNMAAVPQGKKEAVQLLGAGVMMTGIMVGASIGSPYGPAVMIGSMFAGAAIMALGK